MVLLGGSCLRLYGLGEENYWLDELHSLADSAGRRGEFESLRHGVVLDSIPRFPDLRPESTWPAVWRKMRDDSHPPTYFLLLLSWRRFLGDGEFAVRLLAAAASILSLVPFALMFRRLCSPRWALAATAVLAATYCHIHLAQENRPYSLGLMFVSLCYWSLVELCHTDFGVRRWWFVVYGVATYFAVLTHYFTVLALLPQVVLALERRNRRMWPLWFGTGAVAAAAFVVTWGPQFVEQLDFIFSQDWLREDRLDHNLRTVLRLTDLPIRLLFTHERYTTSYLLSASGIVLLAAAALSVRHYRVKRASVFAAWYFVPVLSFAAIDLVTYKQVLTHVRYTSVALPGLVGLLVLAAWPLARHALWALLAVFAVLSAATIELPTQHNPKNERAARLIAEQLEPGDLLVFDAMGWPSFWTARIYHIVSYYLPQHLTTPFPPVVLLRDPPTDTLQEEITRFRRLIVVAPRQEIPNPAPDRYRLVLQTGYVEMVGFIYLFERLPGRS